MLKDLTTLKWKKYIYYTSNNVIFDIESRKKKFDIDSCETYIIDFNNAPEKIKKANDGTSIDISKYLDLFIGKVPYIEITFVTDGGRELKRYFPVLYLIEEGDKVIEGLAILVHPNVYDGSYLNKFNQEIFKFIKDLVKNKELFNPKNIDFVLNLLPDWLTISEEKYMTEDYIDKYFLRGFHYNQNLAIKPEKDIYKFVSIKLNDKPINIWNKETISKCLKAIDAEKLVNKYNNSVSISKNSMEEIANFIKNVKETLNNKNLLTFLHIDENEVVFESLCTSSDVDTYYEYLLKVEEEKQRIRLYFALVKDEESWNLNNQEGKGLYKYYLWSDLVNVPYKEDLWNTEENRAANINDAKKDEETGELMTDEYGNYIYENCERCWQGAINAPGAKYPWIVVNITDEIPSTVTFKYTYPDGTVKEVQPWGDKIFGGPEDAPRRDWGVVSVASEFNDNNFLISENRTDGGESTFDINNFELILNPVE